MSEILHNKSYLNTKKLLVIYINLCYRNDKNNSMRNEFKKHNINDYERFDAIDGKNLNIPDLYILIADCKMSSGQYGCYLSHKQCYIKFLNSQEDYMLVFEDDVLLKEDFSERFENIMKIMNKQKIDFMYLSRSDIKFDGKFKETGGLYQDEFIYRPIVLAYGFFSYVISKEGARKFLKILNHYENNMWKRNPYSNPHNLPPYGLPIDCLDKFYIYGRKNLDITMKIYCVRDYLAIGNLGNISDT
jgi:GR25 family glycosyltransferase involved in LPS biosynthesis